jgi:hypothetical protein
METLFVAGKEGFSTLVHVPLIEMKSALTIWEHHILLIPLTNDFYLNLGPEDYTHLAVTADLGLYRAMRRPEFNTCRRVGEFYLCDRGLVVTKAPKLIAPPPPLKDPTLCLFFALRKAIRAGEGNMPNNDRGNGGRHEDGIAEFVRII